MTNANSTIIRSGLEGITLVSSGMFAGVMLFIGITLGGYWQSLEAQQFLVWFAANNDLIKRTVPLVALPTLLGSVFCIYLCRDRPSRRWWIASLLCWLIVAILTFAFFVPMNSSFAARAVPTDEVADNLSLWLVAHWGRIISGVAATFFAYLAVSQHRNS